MPKVSSKRENQSVLLMQQLISIVDFSFFFFLESLPYYATIMNGLIDLLIPYLDVWVALRWAIIGGASVPSH